MRLALCAALLTIASVPGALAAAGGSQLLLGNIHYGYEPPAIAGPHRLVMVAGMGNDHMRVDTSSAEAQRWFDYALTLSRAFEHADAKLAFRKAAALDPACSLCIWGEAYSRGPTINYLVDRADSAAALKLALEARRVAGPHLAAEERRLESAMIDHYRHPGDNGSGDLRYARDLDAMLHDDPGNLELEIFDAEAWLVMEFHNDRSGLAPAVSRLTPLVHAHPDYTGLVHFYIHAAEDAGEPQLAEAYAARLAELCPNASHLVHMPSHTYYRVGRYEDAALANVGALKADLSYARETHSPTPLSRLMYHFHDIQFGLAAALLSGDRRIALRLIDQFNRDFPDPAAYDNHAEMTAGVVYAGFGRLAAPGDVLSAPQAPASKPFLVAMRHYARGEAFARRGNAAAVRAEADRLGSFRQSAAEASWGNLFSTTVRIANLVLVGRADRLAGNPDAAVTVFREAADLQDRSFGQGGDPPRWWYPVRRSLAAALLARGDAAAAEREASAVLGSWKLDPVTLAIRSRAERARNEPRASSDAAAARRGWFSDPEWIDDGGHNGPVMPAAGAAELNRDPKNPPPSRSP
jgi:tetratricopeptide (TPR) repeat protein